MLSTLLEGSVKDLRDAAAVAIAREIAAVASAAAAGEGGGAADRQEAVISVVAVHDGEVFVRLLQPSMLPQVW